MMRLNENVALASSKVLLVPYCHHHVPTYHEWMQDPDLQAATASEPLSVEEEYSMQQSWRQDQDKLTFIICKARPDVSGRDSITAREEDNDKAMIGDINLFLADEDDEVIEHNAEPSSRSVVGEIELMVARKDARQQGYGRASLHAFLHYILEHLSDILAEYDHSNDRPRFSYLRVKINQENHASLALFGSLGFRRTTEHANYFGELELRWTADMMHLVGRPGYERPIEMVYVNET